MYQHTSNTDINAFVASVSDDFAKNYYIKPNVTETNNDKMNIELEFMVNNGAIGDIRVLDYRMGKLK